MARDITMPVLIDQIDIPNGRKRDLDNGAIQRLAESIETIGLKHPITVRRKDSDRYELIAGEHRFHACKKIGMENIPACIVTMTNAEARMWEIAENLHRAELSKLERAEHIEEWRKLAVQLGQQSHNSKGLAKTAEHLGVSRQEVHRSEKIAHLTPEAKDAAREVGIDNNQSKLLEAAKERPDRQAAKVVELASRKPMASEKWLSDGMLWWNRGAKEWRDEFLARIEKPVMDNRFG